MTSAEKSIIPEFKLTLEKLGVEKDFKITRNRVVNNVTGSFILFSGIKTGQGDQTANLKSIIGITTWVIEEGEDFLDEKSFDSIDDSIRTKSRQNRIIWIQNPSTKEHFIYKRWILPNSKSIDVHGFPVTVSNMPTVEHIHSTYHIAVQYLSDSFLNKAKVHELKTKLLNVSDKTRSWYYTNYIGGWLEKAEGVVFENWEEGYCEDESIPYCYGQDYGYSPDPHGIIRVAVDQKAMKIYLKEIAYSTKLSTKDILYEYEHGGIKKTDLIVTDTNEPRTTNEIRKKGWNIVGALKREIKEDIRDMKPYTLIVDPSSENVKMELNNYVWNDKKASIPIDKFNHLLDPIRYGFRRLVRSKRKGVKRR